MHLVILFVLSLSSAVLASEQKSAKDDPSVYCKKSVEIDVSKLRSSYVPKEKSKTENKIEVPSDTDNCIESRDGFGTVSEEKIKFR